jgi:hypothetical protein
MQLDWRYYDVYHSYILTYLLCECECDRMICVHRDGFVCCDKFVCDKPFCFFGELYDAMMKK